MKSISKLHNSYSQNISEFVWSHSSEEVQKLRAFLIDMKTDTKELDYFIQAKADFDNLPLEDILDVIFPA